MAAASRSGSAWGRNEASPPAYLRAGTHGLLALVAPPASTAVAAAAPAVATSAATAPAAAALGLGPGLVDGQGAAADLLAVERLDGGLGFLVGLHLHEAEALGAAGVPVHDDLGRLHRAVRLE